MKKIRAIFLVSLFATTTFAASLHYNTSGTQFTKTLKLGVRDREVYYLQRVLNSNPATTITKTGPGSLGNESDYFGGLTQKAVIKFQEMYASETLTPAGLTAGSGLVGALTRAKLNKLSGSASQVNTPIVITNFRPANPAPGATVTANGTGFTPTNNTLTIGSSTLSALTSSDGLTLSFTLPVTVTPGAYTVAVNNASGTSNKVKLTVVKPGLPSPSISSISPTGGKAGTVVTITGDNFSPTGNTVNTGYDTLRGVSSPDGETLTITINPPFAKQIAVDSDVASTIDFWIYIENGSGRSEPVVFSYNPF